jgi:hypothetical protein
MTELRRQLARQLVDWHVSWESIFTTFPGRPLADELRRKT